MVQFQPNMANKVAATRAKAMRTAFGQPKAATASSADSCHATPTPADPICSFRCQPGTLALKVTGKQGSVQFLSASYNGTAIAGTPAASITFTVAQGQHNLDVVYAFSDTVAGQGELHEDCQNSTLLDPNVSVTNPAVRYVVCV